MTPVLRSQSSEEAMRSTLLANMQPGSAPSVLPMANQPVYQGQRVVMKSPMQAGPALMSSSPAFNSSFGSSQMQTPPPTRGASTRRLHPHQAAFGTPTTTASHKFTTPQQQPILRSNDMQPAPAQFPLLQFPSNTYQSPNGVQTSAAVQPPSQMFWNQPGNSAMYLPAHQQQQQQQQQQAHQQMVQQQTPQPHQQSQTQAPRILDDPFAPASQSNLMWANGLTPNLQTVAFDTPAMVSFPTQEVHTFPAQMSFNGTSSMVPCQDNPNPTGVDPSLLSSSSMHPEIRSSSTSALALPQQPTIRRQDSGNLNLSRPNPVAASSKLKPAAVAGVRRSSTTAGTRAKSAQYELSHTEQSGGNSIAQAPRTASPLKRVARAPLGPISELKPAKRASVILTIDENGRARTETFPRHDSPTKSMRERYPGLYDSDSSDDESDVSETPSYTASASLSFVKGDERRLKAARLDPPIENLEGLDIPRSTSGASMKGVAPSRAAIAAVAQLRRSGSSRKASSGRHNAARRSFIGVSQTPLIDSSPVDLSIQPRQASTATDSDTVEHETAGVGSRKHSLLARHQDATLDAHNRRWSMMSFEQQMAQSMLPSQQTHDMPSYHGGTASSHVIHAARPAQGMQIRCLCGVSLDQGQTMVRCVSCTQWLHASCISVDGQPIPTNYLCFLCTKPAMKR
nr:hypothetical protein CFP56_46744 [Quercus suber]